MHQFETFSPSHVLCSPAPFSRTKSTHDCLLQVASSLQKAEPPSVPWAHFSAHRCSSACYTCPRVQECLFLLSFLVLIWSTLPSPAGGRTQKQICNNYVGKIPVYSPFLFLQLRSLLNMEFSSKMFNSGVNFEDISVIFYLLFKKRKRKEKNAKV